MFMSWPFGLEFINAHFINDNPCSGSLSSWSETTASSLQVSAKFIKYLNDQLAKSLGLLSSTSKCCVFEVFVWSNDVSQLLTMKATTSVSRHFQADSLSRRSLGRSCFTFFPSVLSHEGKSCFSANMAKSLCQSRFAL